MLRTLGLSLLLALSACSSSEEMAPTGRWEAWLVSPGGKLQFELRLSHQGESPRAEISGGVEILRPLTRYRDGKLRLEFPHFDSFIEAEFDPESRRLDGFWRKTTGHGETSELAFHARVPGDIERTAQQRAEDSVDEMARAMAQMEGSLPSVAGRWAVDFDSSEDLAVGIFEQLGGQPEVRGSFLTTTGDYRYLWGEISPDGRLQLQAFDGAHAFLFVAQLGSDESLEGDFWSRDSWHERWSAVRDDYIQLPDPFGLTRVDESIPLSQLRYPDLEGVERALDDPSFAGQARIIELFGSWCPNCWDATQYLRELDLRYRERGLAILGLAFELSGDPRRDTDQLKRYVETQEIAYPVLLAGSYDKAEASVAFPLVDRVRSYPTFLFLDANGRVRAIYTGFSGPATGPAHESLKRGFESWIEALLSEGSRPER